MASSRSEKKMYVARPENLVIPDNMNSKTPMSHDLRNQEIEKVSTGQTVTLCTLFTHYIYKNVID